MSLTLSRPVWRWGAAALSGLLLNLVQSLNPWWPAAWVALIPLLIVVSSASWRQAIWLSLVAGLLGQAAMASYYARVVGEAGWAVAVVIAAIFTLPSVIPFMVVVSALGSLRGTARHWLAPFAFPLVAAGVDLIFARVSVNGAVASWANSQMGACPVIQSAALGGTSAIVFLVSLFASTVSVAVLRHGRILRPGLAYGLPGVIISAAIAYGYVRLGDESEFRGMTVGLVAADQAAMEPDNAGGPLDATLVGYLRAAESLASRRASVIVLPEKIEALDAAGASQAQARLSEWSRDHQAHLLAGFAVIKPDHSENRAWLFDRDGRKLADYVKHHHVPLVERAFRPGTAYAIVEFDDARLGIAICKDMDFSPLARVYGRAGVQIMLVPAWDFDLDAVWHARMAVLRGVEQGFSVVRAARDGVLTVSDPYGRIVAEEPSDRVPVTSALAIAPLGGIRTVYGRLGDLFGWTCAALSGLLCLWRLRFIGSARHRSSGRLEGGRPSRIERAV